MPLRHFAPELEATRHAITSAHRHELARTALRKAQQRARLPPEGEGGRLPHEAARGAAASTRPAGSRGGGEEVERDAGAAASIEGKGRRDEEVECRRGSRE